MVVNDAAISLVPTVIFSVAASLTMVASTLINYVISKLGLSEVFGSIGAFHWMDRASMFLSQRENSKKKLFLQTVSEAVVQNIRKLLQVYPMLIMATKSVIYGNRHSTASNEVKGNMEERCSKNMTRNHQNFQYREYMPSVWQSFVTHRILVHSSDEHSSTTNHQKSSIYLLEWLLPRLSFPDKIVVKDAGVFVQS